MGDSVNIKPVSRTSLFAFLCFTTWFALLLWHSWHGPDIWYHLTWGRDLIENGHWIPQTPVLLTQPIPANGYWLFQAFIYLAFKHGGIYLVSGIFALAWLVMAALWMHISQIWSRVYGPFLAAAFVIIMQLRFEHRPEVFSYLFVTLMTYFAWRGKLWPLFLVQVLWTQVHGYFVMGPFIAALILFQAARDWRRCLKVLVALLLVTLISPFGYKNWISVWNYAQFGRALSDLNHELFMPAIWPLHWTTAAFWLAWLATAFVVVRAAVKRTNVPYALLAAGGLFLSAQMVRNMPLLFLFAPLLWRGVECAWKTPRWQTVTTCLAAAAGVIMSVSVVTGRYHSWTGALSRFGVRFEPASYPITSAKFLENRYFKGKIFCDSYDGGYLEYHLPNVQVAGDSYFADEKQTRRFFAAIKEPQALAELNSQMRFDAFLINVENMEVFNMLLHQQEWVVAFADSHRALFVNRAGNPQLDGELSKFTFYEGEDLHHWTYEYGIVSWMALAYQNHLPALMRKVTLDMAQSKYVPPMPYKVALKFATENRDEELLKTLADIHTR